MTEREYRYRVSGRLRKERRMSLCLCSDGVVFTEDCGSIIVFLGIQRFWVSSISHLDPGARGLGESVVYEKIHDNLTWPFLRCYPLCWKIPSKSLIPCPLQGGHTLAVL